MNQAPLLILSGPSGSGKSTVIRRLLAAGELPLRLSVSATTRPPRPGEQDGVDYYFWTRPQFEAAIAAAEFLEWATVFGNYYGTLKREVERLRSQGFGVILDIDVQGAAQVRQKCPESVMVFLTAPSLETYEQRLRQRHTETEAAIQRRLAAVAGELAHAGEYQYRVVNDDREVAVRELHDIFRRHFTRA
jgi:guanylate kinase